MSLTQKEIRDRATVFAHEWADASRERAEAQTFWNEFFNVFGLKRQRVAYFEGSVKKLGDKKGAIDLFWPGNLIVEHKSRGESLDIAYRQALDYFPGIKEAELPKYVVVSDFARFRLYDLEEGTQFEFTLESLSNNIHRFGFISGYTKRTYKDEDPVNIRVAMKMGELHDAFFASGYSGHELEVFLVRLVYCLFADDTGIFQKDLFRFLIEERTREDGTDTGPLIESIFQVLNTSQEKRQTTLGEEFQQFPYVNGLLFDERLTLPSFNKFMRGILLECCAFDWGKVSPAIFGSLFQSVMNQQKRRDMGAHYTSERNILKVVKGLFLDDLYRTFESIKTDIGKLRKFHEQIGRLRFFDPACGCGSFLIISYREIRRLETEVIKQLHKLSGVIGRQLEADVTLLSRIDVDAFYGIEMEEFPARIAEVALWLTDHQMNMELSSEFGQTFVRLPLRKSPHITHGNALRIDWETFVPRLTSENTLYLLGNPPFSGKKRRTDTQKEDMEIVFGEIAGYGVLDYVCAWYVKAARYIQNTSVKVAFVSTNSITQGEQVGTLWHYLLSKGIKINFAHRTFKWTSEARGVAQVYCVIIGFAAFDVPVKRLYDYEAPASEPMEIVAKNINPYLVDADDIVIVKRRTPICNVPKISNGSMPNDEGHLLFSSEEKDEFLIKEPGAAKYIRPLISSDQFINGKNRWCLWLKDAIPTEIRQFPEVMRRVDAVRRHRLESPREATQMLADYPTLFGEIRQPDSDYIIVPRHSSELRKYLPMSLLQSSDAIASDSCDFIQNATLYHFGVLTSAMHMAWFRQVCGRIKSDYRYSNTLVYNNFPWPEKPTPKQQDKVTDAAQNVLDLRAEFPDASLADLYDPNAMPKELLDAHKTLDAAVDSCYRSIGFKTDLERLTYLFELYRKYAEPLVHMTRALSGRRKNTRTKGQPLTVDKI